MTVYDAHGLVTDVSQRSTRPVELSSPGHDIIVPRAFFYEHEPTVTHLKIIKRYPEDTFVERIKYFTESWRTIGARWKRYVPEILSLREYPDRRSEVVLIWRLIEEAPHVKTLPMLERKSIRKRRAFKEWEAFYVSLEQ